MEPTEHDRAPEKRRRRRRRNTLRRRSARCAQGAEGPNTGTETTGQSFRASSRWRYIGGAPAPDRRTLVRHKPSTWTTSRSPARTPASALPPKPRTCGWPAGKPHCRGQPGTPRPEPWQATAVQTFQATAKAKWSTDCIAFIHACSRHLQLPNHKQTYMNFYVFI